MEGYVDVEAMCNGATKEERKLTKKEKQKEGRAREGTSRKTSKNAEEAKKLRSQNDEFIKLKGTTKKGKPPPAGSCYNIFPPLGEAF